jgi:hypothetical protein
MITQKDATNEKLIELMAWLKPYTPDERLEMLLEAARTTGLKELEKAIIGYWLDETIKDITRVHFELLCPKCSSKLEIDEEYMQKHYGETNVYELPLERLILWCGNCEQVYNGNKEKV